MSTAKAGTVKLSAARKTETVELPSVEGSRVEVYCNLLVAEQRTMQAKYPDPESLNQKEQSDMSLYMLTFAVKGWNLVGDDDQPIPVSQEIFDKFTLPDILKMLEVCTGQRLLDENNRPLQAKNAIVGKKANAS